MPRSHNEASAAAPARGKNTSLYTKENLALPFAARVGGDTLCVTSLVHQNHPPRPRPDRRAHPRVRVHEVCLPAPLVLVPNGILRTRRR